MIQHIFLQVSTGTAIIAAILVALIISVIFFAIQRKSISSIKNEIATLRDPKIKYDVERIQKDLNSFSDNLTDLKTSIPHTTEVSTIHENVTKLCTDFTNLKTTLDGQMDLFRLNTTEDLNKTKDEMIKNATQQVTEYANIHLTENSVSREEFESLKERIEKMLGADEVAERMEVLSLLFDSSQIRTLNWQCKLIKLLNGGLAPEAEEDLIISEGIPKSSCEKFLKKLTRIGITEDRTISAFYMLPNFEWIYSYVENPDWLQKRLEGTIKKEKEYQQYIKNNLNKIENGLLLEHSEYELATGKIDFICRDSEGKAVGLELKYPTATTAVKRQIWNYKNEYEAKTGKTDSRFIVVAPKIPENLKTLLVNDGFEYREIDF